MKPLVKQVSRMKVRKILSKIATGIAVLLSLYFLYTTIYGINSPLQHRAIFLVLILTIAFLELPISSKSGKKFLCLDLILVALSILSLSYVIFDYMEIPFRVGAPNRTDIIYGVLTIILILEFARRQIGFQIVLLPLIFLVYMLWGDLIPGNLGHPAVSLTRTINTLFLTTSGIFGIPLGAAATYVVIFIILGSFLEKTGVGSYFIKLAYSLTGRVSSGPAQAAVVASGLMGMISGSPSANVATTGTFTIPLMKSSGYSSEKAGAVEAVASVGGQVMPPIMGASAFVIAEMLEISYLQLIAVAFPSALLYYFGVSVSVHLDSVKQGIKPDKSKVPKPRKILLEGWWYLLPILLLIYMLVFVKVSVFRAAIWSLAASLVVSFFNKEGKLSFRSFINTLGVAGKKTLIVGAATACAGIIVGAVTATGLGLKISMIVTDIAGGNMLLSLILIWCVAVILGMGLPTVAAYITTVVLLAPALIDLGVTPIVAHFFVFYGAIVSNLTPPVCIASYTAAGISGGNSWKTALMGLSFGLPGPFLVPYLFVYKPALLFVGSPGVINFILAVIPALLAIISLAFVMRGYFLARFTLWQRFLMAASCILLIPQSSILNLVGFVIFGLLVGYQIIIKMNQSSVNSDIISNQ